MVIIKCEYNTIRKKLIKFKKLAGQHLLKTSALVKKTFAGF